MKFLAIFLLAFMQISFIFGKPLLSAMLPGDKHSVLDDVANSQLVTTAVSLRNAEPDFIHIAAVDDYNYECLPMENGPWEDCRGLDTWLSNSTAKHSDNFLINVFVDRCWTLQAGICRLYVCQNATIASDNPATVIQMNVNAKWLQRIVNEAFQADCNQKSKGLAGHAWNENNNLQVYSGVA